MRISDWSSDVCSPDLRFHDENVELASLGASQQLSQPGTRRGGAAHRGVAVDCGQGAAALLDQAGADTDLVLDGGGILLIGGVAAVDRSPIAILRSHDRPHSCEIGRASCRERVCQYV